MNINRIEIPETHLPRDQKTVDQLVTPINGGATAHKLTAEQVEKECSARLQQIAKEIKQRLSKADKQTQLAEDNMIAVEKLLEEAKELCDDGGFEKFRELFCPQLGKSRAHELLQIAAGKKSLGEIKANTRARVAKHRADKAAVASVTVTDSSPREAEDAPTDAESRDAIDAKVAAGDEAAKHRRTINAKDEALFDFSARVMELNRLTGKRKPYRFAKTSVPADILSRLGKFLTDLATIKNAPETNV
jgi:hypothetical protein